MKNGLFVLVVVGILFLIGAAVTITLGRGYNPFSSNIGVAPQPLVTQTLADGWIQATSSDAAFVAEFPALPTYSDDSKPGLPVDFYGVHVNGMSYAVWRLKGLNPVTKGETATAVTDELIATYEQNASLLSKKDSVMGSYTYTDLQLKLSEDGSLLYMRIIAGGNDTYLLSVGQVQESGNTNANRFFDSFKELH